MGAAFAGSYNQQTTTVMWGHGAVPVVQPAEAFDSLGRPPDGRMPTEDTAAPYLDVVSNLRGERAGQKVEPLRERSSNLEVT